MTTIPKIVDVALGTRSYSIHIAPGALDKAGALLAPFARRDRLMIVTDDNIVPNQLYRLQTALNASTNPNGAIANDALVLPPGESTKSWANVERVTDWLLDKGVERSDTIIALGGGVIGDLVGFAASILKRGCRFVQIPTTLLSQVDSSVGGKTAINSRAGKNLIGAFHQPVFVLIDPTTLDTLPVREVRAGYAEVVKYGLIDDPAFFAWCDANVAALLAGDPQARTHAIEKSVTAKARIVGEDEFETTGRRALLNLGHTFGHALEAETGYSDTLLHGEAVACGMALAFRFSAAQGLCPAEDAARVTAHLQAAGLPATLRTAHVDTSGAKLVEHMMHDKKMEGGKLPFLLARGIGQTFLDKQVDLGAVERFLDGERSR